MLGVGLAATILLTGLAVAPAHAEPTDTDRYIVRTATSAAATLTVSRLLQARVPVEARYRSMFDGFAAELTAAQVQRLRADPSVAAIRPDFRIGHADLTRQAISTQPGSAWGLDRIDQRATRGDGRYIYDTTGSGVTVFVIDSGVRADHSELSGRVRSGYDFVDGDPNAADCEGHSTHVAGTVAGTRYGVAKRATVVALRVLDCAGSGWGSDSSPRSTGWLPTHRQGPRWSTSASVVRPTTGWTARSPT